MQELLKKVTEGQVRTDLPQIRIGDTVQVFVKITEGNRQRVQMFEGTVIAMKNGKLPSATLTVRRISFGVGVEKTFMLNGPTIDTIKIVRHGKARRAKLFFLRNRVGKSAKLQEKLGIKDSATSTKKEAVVETAVEEVAVDAVVAEETVSEEVASPAAE